jgi:hypothetical protein
MPDDNTDPLYQQLVTEEEYELARQKRERGKYHKKQKRKRADGAPSDEGPPRDYANDSLESSQGGYMKIFIDMLIPPINDDPERVRRWRICVGFGTIVLFFHVAWACGFLAPLGLSGFAYANDVDEIKTTMLEESLFESRVRQCTAQTSELRQIYGNRVQQLLTKYQQTTGENYQLPGCAELQ